jgi:hypothetical protein
MEKHGVSFYNANKLEYWSDGVMIREKPILQYSVTPIAKS